MCSVIVVEGDQVFYSPYRTGFTTFWFMILNKKPWWQTEERWELVQHIKLKCLKQQEKVELTQENIPFACVTPAVFN